MKKKEAVELWEEALENKTKGSWFFMRSAIKTVAHEKPDFFWKRILFAGEGEEDDVLYSIDLLEGLRALFPTPEDMKWFSDLATSLEDPYDSSLYLVGAVLGKNVEKPDLLEGEKALRWQMKGLAGNPGIFYEKVRHDGTHERLYRILSAMENAQEAQVRVSAAEALEGWGRTFLNRGDCLSESRCALKSAFCPGDGFNINPHYNIDKLAEKLPEFSQRHLERFVEGVLGSLELSDFKFDLSLGTPEGRIVAQTASSKNTAMQKLFLEMVGRILKDTETKFACDLDGMNSGPYLVIQGHLENVKDYKNLAAFLDAQINARLACVQIVESVNELREVMGQLSKGTFCLSDEVRSSIAGHLTKIAARLKPHITSSFAEAMGEDNVWPPHI
jgi:hypothetical protein